MWAPPLSTRSACTSSDMTSRPCALHQVAQPESAPRESTRPVGLWGLHSNKSLAWVACSSACSKSKAQPSRSRTPAPPAATARIFDGSPQRRVGRREQQDPVTGRGDEVDHDLNGLDHVGRTAGTGRLGGASRTGRHPGRPIFLPGRPFSSPVEYPRSPRPARSASASRTGSGVGKSMSATQHGMTPSPACAHLTPGLERSQASSNSSKPSSGEPGHGPIGAPWHGGPMHGGKVVCQPWHRIAPLPPIAVQEPASAVLGDGPCSAADDAAGGRRCQGPPMPGTVDARAVDARGRRGQGRSMTHNSLRGTGACGTIGGVAAAPKGTAIPGAAPGAAFLGLVVIT